MPPAMGLGVQNLLQGGVSDDHPMSFAETPSGLLLLANGVDPVLKWDGLAASLQTAGVLFPQVAPQLGGSGLGYITGKIVAYVRFIDSYGNPSNLSPASNLVDTGYDGFISFVDYDKTSGAVTVTAPNHGLTGTQALAIDGVGGLPVNGQWNITVVDTDHFTLSGVTVNGGLYTGGGIWTMGIQTLVYGAVPLPTEGKVVRRQILRNLAGSADVLYVDIDTTDLTSTVFMSRALDAELATGVPVAFTYGTDDLPYANRNGVPPAHKSVIASHKGRIYATADAEYSIGHAEVAFGQATVVGVCTNWRTTFVGRSIYFQGASKSYTILAVDEVAQTLVLNNPYLDPPAPYLPYVIRPDPAERRLVYYTEPGLAESWPEYNALAIPEMNDEIVGMLSLGQYLYIIERRNIHRFTFQGDPSDGYTFLSSTRGAINNRCYAVADNIMYALDEIGIHKFDGQASVSISQPIQNIFQEDGAADIQVDWDADQTFWHAAHDPVRDTIRWFVSVIGTTGLTYCICYNYRTERWWLEQYPTSVQSSTNATFGARRSLVGTDARRVLALGVGSYDGVDGSGTLRGSPTSATSTVITDSGASFPACEGAPISIVSGTGRGQTSVVAFVTATTIEVVQPFAIPPDTTSVYQIGGVTWEWRSGWFRFLDSEDTLQRDVEIVFLPTTVPTEVNMQVYLDHSLTPYAWDRTISQDGVATTEGDSNIVVEFQTDRGWARQRWGTHASVNSFGINWISIELDGVQAGDLVRVAQVVLNGVEEGR